ncbi:DhaKLM operon coactivator DhaQ [Streptococcus suis]|nr:DhaKLM operon coactivator DhaQ [Streptococcus suis]
MVTFIHNKKENIISDYVSGQLLPYSHLKHHETLPLVYNKFADDNCIPVLCGGGSGHEPSHIGFVGDGMLTGALYGTLFAPPTVEQIADSIRFLDKGKGVFLIIKNFEADLKNFREAMLITRAEGHNLKYIISHDDISIEPKSHYQIRGRGLAGTIILHKIIGEAARQGYTLNQLEELAFEVSTQTATIGFATKPAVLPRAALPLFDLENNTISYGIGIHGEEGYRIVPFTSSENLANEITNKLRLHFHWKKNDQFILIVNNLGTTTDIEMGIFLNDVSQLLDLEDVKMARIKLGKYMTSIDMAGISVTLCHIKNIEILKLFDAPTNAFAW